MAAGPCEGLSWEHWANIDPHNAAPWLEIAAKADSSGDQQEIEEALAKASKASRIDTYSSTIVALALNALPPDLAPLDKTVAGADVTSALGMATPGTAYCDDALFGDGAGGAHEKAGMHLHNQCFGRSGDHSHRCSGGSDSHQKSRIARRLADRARIGAAERASRSRSQPAWRSMMRGRAAAKSACSLRSPRAGSTTRLCTSRTQRAHKPGQFESPSSD